MKLQEIASNVANVISHMEITCTVQVQLKIDYFFTTVVLALDRVGKPSSPKA